eukprot:c18874_g1_i1 orf=365-1387(+)
MEQGIRMLQHLDCDGGLQLTHTKTPDRMKRDEWSEGAVVRLLDAYEAKWILRNRAKLKGNDWEEVARQVCARNGGTKPLKTQSQCKNKIEALKKRYRSEATNFGTSGSFSSTWSFFHRMDLLLRCPANATACPGYVEAGGQPVVTELGLQEALPQVETADSEQVVLNRAQEITVPTEFFPTHDPTPISRECHHQHESSQEDASNTLPLQPRHIERHESETSTLRGKIAHGLVGSEQVAAKRRKNSTSEVAESIRSFADSILKLEQAKMEMYKDSERLRAEAEVRRVEMEFKRTEIISKTQLQIAKLLSGKSIKRKSRTTYLTVDLKATAGMDESGSLFRE